MSLPLGSSSGLVRNLCVLAHVDHGKTTLTDSLVASNGLIHPRMAGRLRYLDSRDDEQARGITMKASCVSLLYNYNADNGGGNGNGNAASSSAPPTPSYANDAVAIDTNNASSTSTSGASKHVLHLVDSPGHVDFDAEAAAAARVSDGAYVVVDAAEGVRVQTRASLRRSFDERLAPVLVINKLDRLFTELAMSPLEVFQRCRRLVDDANAVMSAFHSELHLADADNEAENGESTSGGEKNDEQESPSHRYWGNPAPFDAARGNVVFASAIDGWAFRTCDFARVYAKRWECKAASLTKVLFGDYAFNPKTKKVLKTGKGATPMFAQFIVEPLSKIYAIRDASIASGTIANGEEPPHAARMKAIATSLGLDKLPGVAKELVHRDANVALRALLQAWMPLAETLMATAVECFPCPSEAMAYRWPVLCPSEETRRDEGEQGEGVLFFVAKMAVVPSNLLGRGGADDELVAFGRVFRGTLLPGQSLCVLGETGPPRWGTAEAVYLSMGRAFHQVSSAPVGNLVAVAGLGDVVVKSATLASQPGGTPLLPLSRHFRAAPVVRVAVSPTNGVADLPRLAEGLRRLHAIDPLVEVVLAESGEHVVCAAGEVHLDTCLRDLQDVFAKVPVTASAPLVQFKETVTHGAGDAWGQWCSATSADSRLVVRARARPMPIAISSAILDHAVEISALFSTGNDDDIVEDGELSPEQQQERQQQVVDFAEQQKKVQMSADVDRVRDAITRALNEVEDAHSEDARDTWRQLLSRLWALGSRGGVANALLATDEQGASEAAAFLGLAQSTESEEKVRGHFAWQVRAGFQLACAGGPLCEEPLHGVCFEADVQWADGIGADEIEECTSDTTFAYRTMLLSRDVMRQAVLSAGPRLVQAMYSCEISTSSEGLGGTYAAVGRARGRVVSETMLEGTGDFLIAAMLPVARSFGFVEDLRSRSGGSANASMAFSHWEELESDPTARVMAVVEGDEDGIEDESLGNIAVEYVDNVRRRKGLAVEEKVVKSATKQRTRARKV